MSQPSGYISRRRYQIILLSCLMTLLLSGCQVLLIAPLPTIMSTAEFPVISPTAAKTRETMPPTFTPMSPTEEAVAATLTIPPSPTAEPTSTALPTMTPVIYSGSYPRSIEAPYIESPPSMTECDGAGSVFQSRFPSQVGGPRRNYHVYLPPCYGQDGRVYPVAYLIHGSIQTDSHWLDLGLARYIDEGIASGRYPPFIAIMPYSGKLGNISSGGWNSIEGVTLGYLLPYIDDTFCTWREAAGRSIGGISRGGYWALEIAFNNPELFGAVSGHSSHLRLATDPEKYNPLVTYATADLTNMRIWMDRGEKDFLRPGQNQLHQSLEEAGIPHEYRVNPGGHSDVYWADHLAEYLDWHTALWPKNREAYPPCK